MPGRKSAEEQKRLRASWLASPKPKKVNMAYSNHMSATYAPGDDDYMYSSPPRPELMAPKPERIKPEMPAQIAQGMKNMDLNAQRQHSYPSTASATEEPHLSPFPKLVNPPPNVPPSDDRLEATLESARSIVLNSNDPEMQLAWASDALIYVGVCADNEERTAAAKPHTARSATPRVEHQLKVDAMNVINFLADQHHPRAEFLKGMWLEWGRYGQREDKKEAFRCYSRAADNGYARAEYRIGMLYESYNDPIKALQHYNKGVDAGDSASCYRLGMMTLRGQHGQQKDYAKAIDLIRRSALGADENAAQGAYVYGMLLARQLPQIEVPDNILAFDEQQAKMNIEKAAYLKFAKAQLKMGSAYELASMGCEFNPALSMHYNALASRQGEAEADMALSKWFLVGSEGLFPKNEELAYTYAERAAQSGLATAEFALGYFNEIGVYVHVDLDKAMEWYQKSSKHGNTDAAGRIEGLSRKQVLSRQDHEKVAVSRIKSQYGSMRGQRPQRFSQQQAPRLDSLQESPSFANSYGALPLNNGGIQLPQIAGVVEAPARGRTPYPETPIVASAPDIRPSSVAPYPLEDGPPTHLSAPAPVGGFFNVQQQPRPSTTLNPDVRPSSAFQINPDFRPNSVAAPEQRPRPQGQFPNAGGPPLYGSGAGPGPGYRPATAQPYDAQGRPPMGNRMASGPAGMQNMQNNPHQPAPLNVRPPPSQAQQPPPQPQQPLNIGFEAPVENRQRQYGPGPGEPGGSRLPRQPQPPPQSGMPPPKTTLPPPKVNAMPPPAASKPLPQPNSRPADGRKPIPTSAKPLTTSSGAPVTKPPAAKPTNTKTSTAPPPSKTTKPGKGPKTFDEMGVPATKQDGDCVIM